MGLTGIAAGTDLHAVDIQAVQIGKRLFQAQFTQNRGHDAKFHTISFLSKALRELYWGRFVPASGEWGNTSGLRYG